MGRNNNERRDFYGKSIAQKKRNKNEKRNKSECNKNEWWQYFFSKFAQENLFMTAENAKGDYEQAKSVILATDNFRDQVINHLGSQQFLGNFKMSESLVNECTKQQDM